MILTPLTRSNTSAVVSSLEKLALNSVEAEAASAGLRPIGCIIRDLSEDGVHQTLVEARKNNVEALSGDGWVILASSAARMGGMVMPRRSGLATEVRVALAGFIRTSFEPPVRWETARGGIPLQDPLVVGILNLTPDSFSDGGTVDGIGGAVSRVEEMVEAGVGMVDIGGESTRPGVDQRLTADQEWDRIGPVLEALVGRFSDLPVSIDTVNSETAGRSIEAGAWAINDVSGLRLDPQIAKVCAERGAGLILMHSRGELTDMASYEHAEYDDVLREVLTELDESVARARVAEVPDSNIVIDPGLGFAKRPEDNLELLRNLSALQVFGLPIMVGPSRKRFLGHVTGHVVDERDDDTATVCAVAHTMGARLFRVHSVPETVAALKLTKAIND